MHTRMITGPASWATALLYDDYSGLEDAEAQQVAAWLHAEGSPVVLDVVSESERFTWSFQLYTNGVVPSHIQGGDVCDYVVTDAPAHPMEDA